MTVERCWRARFEALYFTLHRETRLIGASICYATQATEGIETLDDLILGRFRPAAGLLGVTFLPALVCGAPLGYGWHIGVDPEIGGAASQEAMAEVLDAMEAEADRRGLPLSFAQALEEERELLGLLRRRRYLSSRNVPVAVMDVRWPSIDAYLADMSGKRRRDFRREMRRNHEAGVEVEILESSEGLQDRLLDLLEENSRSHGSIGFPFSRELFAELERNMAARARVFVARKAGAVIGAYVVLIEGTRAVAYAVGVDAEQGGDFTYFQLVYYGFIEYAIANGIERIDFGRGMYAAKLRRGCRLRDAWIYTRTSGARRWLSAATYSFASVWNRAKVSLETRRASAHNGSR